MGRLRMRIAAGLMQRKDDVRRSEASVEVHVEKHVEVLIAIRLYAIR